MSNFNPIIEQPIEECTSTDNYTVQAVLDTATGRAHIWLMSHFEPSFADAFTVDEIDELISQLKAARDYAGKYFTPIDYTLA